MAQVYHGGSPAGNAPLVLRLCLAGMTAPAGDSPLVYRFSVLAACIVWGALCRGAITLSQTWHFCRDGLFRYGGLDSNPSRSMLLLAAIIVIAMLVFLIATDSEDPRAGE
jgi:hypothetical protein